MRTRSVAMILVLASCSSPASGPCNDTPPLSGCGHACSAAAACPLGLHCGSDGHCTAECGTGHACAADRMCSTDGTCVAAMDASFDAGPPDTGPFDAPPTD